MSFISSLHSCYLITFLPSPGNRHTPKYLQEPSLVSSCIVRSSVKKPVGNRSSHTHTHTLTRVHCCTRKHNSHIYIPACHNNTRNTRIATIIQLQTSLKYQSKSTQGHHTLLSKSSVSMYTACIPQQ